MNTAKTIIVDNKVYRPFLVDTLTAEDVRVATEELNETPENREFSLKLLKDLLKGQNEFTSRTDDDFLFRFLRCRKFDCNKAFKMVREYYKLQKVNPGLYVPPIVLKEVLRKCIFNVLPHRDHKGRVIIVIKFDRCDADKISFIDFMAAGNIVGEYALINNSVTQINGFVGIWDYAGFNFKHFKNICSPKNALMLSNFMQDRFPGRFKMAYCINCHPLVKTAWSLIMPFLKEKFRRRIQLIYSKEELHHYLDPSILPLEYGGTMDIHYSDEIAQRVLDKEEYFKVNSKFGY